MLIRAATEDDLTAIAAVTIATGQADDWAGGNPAYVRHLARHGRVVVAEDDGRVAGFGAVEEIGTGDAAITMLCDLFVDPAVHGRGCGRAMLTHLWAGARRRMTFSSLHANAVPLYTSFGLDAWWPLLYLSGDPARLPASGSYAVERSAVGAVAAREHDWTGASGLADYQAWAQRPGAQPVEVRQGSQVLAAGVVLTSGPDRGIVHLANDPAASDAAAAASVAAVLASLGPAAGAASACLPAPHPAVRPLLAAGWRWSEFDLFMASEPGLIDPRRLVPSPGQA